jgi:CBS domain-containing protein
MQLRDILLHKGRRVFTCSPSDSLPQAVGCLVEHNIGSLVVIDDERMVGIITERDMLRACDSGGGSVAGQTVEDRMTKEPVIGSLDDDIEHVMGVMTEHRIRHLPVIDGEELVGLVSIGDVVKAHHAELSQENHYLKCYIHG